MMDAAAQSERAYREETEALKYQLKQARDETWKWKNNK
jgi:hypothetical protein